MAMVADLHMFGSMNFGTCALLGTVPSPSNKLRATSSILSENILDLLSRSKQGMCFFQIHLTHNRWQIG